MSLIKKKRISPIRVTKEDFIKKSNEVHNYKYDYSYVEYVNNKTKVKIKCIVHGFFEQAPAKHKMGQGCRKCGYELLSKIKLKTTKDFIEKARLVHGDKYKYDKVHYKGNRFKVVISCSVHGDFLQTPDNHLSGKGCLTCGNIKSSNTIKKMKNKSRNWNFEQPKDYKLIPLNNGEFSKVDNEDFEKLKDINWNVMNNGYCENKEFGLMHRYIMNTPKGMHTDHINHDTLDNRKSNLRIVNRSENNWNQIKHKGISKYKGVHWHKASSKWMGRISHFNKSIYLGLFTNQIEAAKAYDKKAIELFGEFALTNFKYND